MTKKEYVLMTCDDCSKEMGYAINPIHIPKTWCGACLESYHNAEREYEHPDD